MAWSPTARVEATENLASGAMVLTFSPQAAQRACSYIVDLIFWAHSLLLACWCCRAGFSSLLLASAYLSKAGRRRAADCGDMLLTFFPFCDRIAILFVSFACLN